MTRDSRMISGRVPTIVATLSFVMSHPARHGVRPFPIEDLVRPQHDDQLFVPDVGHVVAPAGNGFDDLRGAVGDVQFMSLPRHKMAKGEARLAFDDEKLLGLRMMIVPSPRDPGVRREKGKLSAIWSLQHLDE